VPGEFDSLASMDHDPRNQLVVLRLSGEISIKAKATRRQFVKRLIRNLKDALISEGLPPVVHRTHDRIFAELPPGSADTGAAALARVFGLQTLSLVEHRPASTVEEVVDGGVELFRERVRGRRFAIRAKRVGSREQIPIRSHDVANALGKALLPFASRVDLSNPEVTVHVELTENGAYFFPDRIAGCGGLPLGTGGRALALMSGGFDSAVAGWLLQKRGVNLDYMFCNLGGRTHEQGVLRVAKMVAERWSYGVKPRLHAVDFDAVSRDLRANTETRYWQIVLKLMLRAAELIAQDTGAIAVATGEAVGQVSSQTLQNLAVISRATDLPILRPLVGFNKDEILDHARRIGTFDLSKVVGEYCAMVPSKPATAAALDVVEAQEEKLDRELLERAVAERTTFNLRNLDAGQLGLPDLEMEQIPAGATVVDLRTLAEFKTWHVDDALHLEFGTALQAYPNFDRNPTYVLYCEIGLKSAHLAELMRAQGLTAYHVPGGLRTLKRS